MDVTASLEVFRKLEKQLKYLKLKLYVGFHSYLLQILMDHFFFPTHIRSHINTTLLFLLKPIEQEEIGIALVRRRWLRPVT